MRTANSALLSAKSKQSWRPPVVCFTFLLPLILWAPVSGRIVLYENFEDDNLVLGSREMCCSHSFSFVTDNVRTGRRAGKFEIRKGDKFVSSGPRSEFRKSLGIPKEGNESWVGFSSYVKPDFSGQHTRIMQWHGEFMLVYNTGKTGCEVNARDCGGKSVNPYPTGNLIRGQWVDWVIHHKWTCSSNGLVEVFRNGTKFLEWKGATLDVQTSHNFKIGIYGTRDYGNWSTSTVIADAWVLHDEVRVGDATSSFAEVNPAQGRTIVTKLAVLQESRVGLGGIGLFVSKRPRSGLGNPRNPTYFTIAGQRTGNSTSTYVAPCVLLRGDELSK